ncbi:SFCGS family glycine-rich protein [Streptomyces sp. M19]
MRSAQAGITAVEQGRTVLGFGFMDSEELGFKVAEALLKKLGTPHERRHGTERGAERGTAYGGEHDRGRRTGHDRGRRTGQRAGRGRGTRPGAAEGIRETRHTVRVSGTGPTGTRLSAAMQQVQARVGKEATGVCFRVEPLDIAVVSAVEHRWTERFLGLLFPRERRRFVLTLSIEARVMALDLDAVDFSVREERLTRSSTRST